MSKHCVILRVKPFEGKETEAGVLVWNDKANVVDLGSPLKNIPLDSIADDGQKNHNILCRYNLINIKQDVYIKSYKYIYLIQPNSCEGIVKYWSYGDWLPSLNEACINVNGELYVIGSLPKHTGSRDIMSDEQLVDWFCKKIITPRWNEIVSRQDFEITESCIKDELNCYNLDSNVYNSRLNRINSICKNFQLYSLQKNTTLSLLSQFLKDSLSNHNAELQELRGMYDLDLKTEIKEKLDEAIEKKRLKLKDLETKQTAIENNITKYKQAEKELDDAIDNKKFEILKLEMKQIGIEIKLKEHEQKIDDTTENKKLEIKELEARQATVEAELNERKQMVAQFDNTIEQKKLELKELEAKLDQILKKKDSIVEEFSVIRDVLSIQPCSRLTPNTLSHSDMSRRIKSIHNEEEPAPSFQHFMSRFEKFIKAYGAEEPDTRNTCNLLSSNKAIITDDMRVIQAIVDATGRCACMYEYVTPQWNSFDNLWNDGLAYMIEQAASNPDMVYYLILRNMNLSYMPSYMQPIMDINSDMCGDIIPSNGYKYPSNMRILGHVNKDVLIPISAYAIENMGCVKKMKFGNRRPDMAENMPHAYLPSSVLNDAKGNEFVSHTEDYVQEDE